MITYVLLQFKANLCALVWIWYLFVKATFGKAYLWTTPDSLDTIKILSLAVMQQIGSLVGTIWSLSEDFADEFRLAPEVLVALRTLPPGVSSTWYNRSDLFWLFLTVSDVFDESSLWVVQLWAVRNCHTKKASLDATITWLVVTVKYNGSIVIWKNN